ncbi:MAG: alanine racemase [Bacteroides sp.]|nr:alanine racemase [Bacteroides sp.]MCM1548661.1 alanine racemase [Clostridium sp.]
MTVEPEGNRLPYYSLQAEVDLDAIRHNIIEMKQQLQTGTKLLAVIKADAYGHGAVAVAKALEAQADYYGVAHVSEAEELREYGIQKPILILGYSAPEEFPDLIRKDITVTIFRLEDARRLSQLAEKMNRTVKIHIKVDTGMNRIGFPCSQEAIEAIREIVTLPGLEAEGIFTHFAKADEKDKSSVEQQLAKFRHMLGALEEEGITFSLRHAANSAAIIELGTLGLDMVRSGISTYGLYPSPEVDRTAVELIPAMSLRSHVIHIKTVPAGEGIGYGWTYRTEKETRIATIPVGYADGYPRALSNQGRVLIHGMEAPVVGRVCMDQMMVDVTGIPQMAVGDVVTLFGRDGEAFLPVEELAAASSSFHYEFLCGISHRVPRVYRWKGRKAAVLDYLKKEPFYRYPESGER